MRSSRQNTTINLLRWILLCCVTISSVFILSNLQYVQETLESSGTLESFSFNIVQSNHPTVDIIVKAENASLSSTDLPCLVHEPLKINASANRVSDPKKTLLEQNTSACGHLRRQWLYNPPLSRFARMIENHQTNCSMPLATHNFDNTFGLGSHLVLWGQAMCNVMQAKIRMRSFAPEWLWLDQQHCDMEQANKSPMLCYFPNSEYRCSPTEVISTPRNVSDPRKVQKHCELVKQSIEIRAEYRAAATEYFFQRASPLLIQEAKRQMGIVFPEGVAPHDLITLHIRWGDKFWEMDLPSIQEYVDAVKLVLPENATTANIYLSTEDPKAYKEFMEGIPIGWNVYPDITLHEINAFRPKKGNRASWATRNTKGRAGLVALGSLLVAMEANKFVLTTKSNWSAMMDNLRTNIVDPRCGNCTQAVDLRPGVW
jgi:hypothetical protein